jgi:hypothetical protein
MGEVAADDAEGHAGTAILLLEGAIGYRTLRTYPDAWL